jgi:HAD superfamily hydrolase (TIGR01458 family)
MPSGKDSIMLKAVLIDLGGVLYVGDEPVPGAAEALRKLLATDLAVRFLTNTSRTPRRTLLARLAAMGFGIEADHLLTAPVTTRKLIERRGLRPHYLVHPAIAEEMGPSDDVDPTAVVLGDAGEGFSYPRLNTAFRFLMRGLPLLAMAKNRYFREGDGLSLDMGAFVAALEYAAGVEAEVVGKPSASFFDTALRDTGSQAADAVMIGDDLRDDIGAAQALGIAGVLVRTGKYRAEDERQAQIRPTAVVADFPAAVDWVLRHRG